MEKKTLPSRYSTTSACRNDSIFPTTAKTAHDTVRSSCTAPPSVLLSASWHSSLRNTPAPSRSGSAPSKYAYCLSAKRIWLSHIRYCKTSATQASVQTAIWRTTHSARRFVMPRRKRFPTCSSSAMQRSKRRRSPSTAATTENLMPCLLQTSSRGRVTRLCAEHSKCSGECELRTKCLISVVRQIDTSCKCCDKLFQG